jgi:riboflavin kinase
MASIVASELYPWFLRSVVVRGHQRGGTQLGFPTANMFLQRDTIEALAPYENGVFFGWGVVESVSTALPVVLSVGHNPHFADKALTVEVHFINKFESDFYGTTIRIIVAGKLREMKKYEGLEALIKDIEGDVRNGLDNLTSNAAAADLAKHPIFVKEMASTEAPVFTIAAASRSGL